MTPAQVDALWEAAQRILADSPRCHDVDHTARVVHMARALAHAEGADPDVVRCAAILHDIGRASDSEDGEPSCHAVRGADQVAGILQGIGIEDEAFIRHVTDCVRTHRFRRRNENPPATPEARVVFDADKLDSLGAIGIGRAFHFAGRIGARVHNTKDEALASDAYSRQDTAYREYLVKLRDLPDSLQTAAGRRLAAQRRRFMAAFFDRLDAEIRLCTADACGVLTTEEDTPAADGRSHRTT